MNISTSRLCRLLLAGACPALAQAQNFVAQPEFARSQLLSQFYARTELHDLDGDGYLDLLGRVSGGALLLQLGCEGGVFREPAVTLPLPADLRIGAGDLDGDGDIDLIATRYSASAQIFWNDGSAHFTAGATLSFAGQTGSDPQVADFDGDARADIALLSINSSSAVRTAVLFFDDGSGTFASSVSVPLTVLAGHLAAIELDGSAPRELIVARARQPLVSIASTGGRSFREIQLDSPTYAERIEQVVDVDGDGREDLILSGAAQAGTLFNTYGVSILYGDGIGGFRAEHVPYAGSRRTSLARAGNLDATGALDLIVAFADGALVWVTGRISPFELGLPFSLANPSDSGPSAGDIDRDGDLDLVGWEPAAFSTRIWSNRARFELRIPFDEASGTSVWDAARPDGRGQRSSILGNTRWQGDPGAGREAFRGNDTGAGVLARGSRAWLSTFGMPEGVPFSMRGSCTLSWWQRMGPTAPQQIVDLLNAAGFQCYSGLAPQPDRLTILRDPVLHPNPLPPYVSTTSIFAPNRWIHIAIAFDAATRQFQLFFDGVADGPPVAAGSSPHGGLQYFLLGGPTYGPLPTTEWFDFDELRYIPRLLSAAQISDLMRGSAITIAPLGNGCFERRATEGLSMHVGAVPGGLVDLLLDTTGMTSGAAVIAFGLSAVQLGGVALPLDLGYGCFLRTSLDVVVPMNVGGVAALRVPLPVTPGVLQGHLYAQGVIFGVGVQTTRAFDLKLRY